MGGHGLAPQPDECPYRRFSAAAVCPQPFASGSVSKEHGQQHSVLCLSGATAASRPRPERWHLVLHFQPNCRVQVIVSCHRQTRAQRPQRDVSPSHLCPRTRCLAPAPHLQVGVVPVSVLSGPCGQRTPGRTGSASLPATVTTERLGSAREQAHTRPGSPQPGAPSTAAPRDGLSIEALTVRRPERSVRWSRKVDLPPRAMGPVRGHCRGHSRVPSAQQLPTLGCRPIALARPPRSPLRPGLPSVRWAIQAPGPVTSVTQKPSGARTPGEGCHSSPDWSEGGARLRWAAGGSEQRGCRSPLERSVGEGQERDSDAITSSLPVRSPPTAYKRGGLRRGTGRWPAPCLPPIVSWDPQMLPTPPSDHEAGQRKGPPKPGRPLFGSLSALPRP